MEHFKTPFGLSDLTTASSIDNQKFFTNTLRTSKNHRFFTHPFMSTFDRSPPSPELASFILTSFYKIVSPFTGLLCLLGARAPNLRSRFALMDNIYEEMGCGDLQSAHPSLYLQMLASIGVRSESAEAAPTLPAIRMINSHLREVVEHGDFAVACALLASAEATIPSSFAVLARMAKRTFDSIDMTFFDRHGPRDEGHSDDAATLFAVSGKSSDFAIAEAAVRLDLEYRSQLLDEWVLAATQGSTPRRVGASVRPGATRDSAPPPA